MSGFFNEIKGYYRFLGYKGSNTLAGALVFFILLGIVPLFYLLTLIISLLGSEVEIIADTFFKENFAEFTNYLILTSKKLGTSGNFIAFCLALYSSANAFFYLKRSGELIYNYYPQNTFLVRAFSILFTFVGVVVFSVLACFYCVVNPIILQIFGKIITNILNILVSFLFVFFCAVLINFYVCPYKVKFKEIFFGSVYTAVFSVIASGLFFAYIKYFRNYNEIYGQVATFIVFISWLFLMMKGLLSGITLNVYFLGRRKSEGKSCKIKNFSKKIKKVNI